MTLSCQLLTAWTLKLPLWPSDLLDAARCGTLPFLAATVTHRGLLKGHRVAERALQFPALFSASELTAATQEFAANIKMVVPELNLGAS